MPESKSPWYMSELYRKAPIKFTMIDSNFEIVQANKFFEDTFGDWRGKKCYEFFKHRNSQCEECETAKVFDDGHTCITQEYLLDRFGNSKLHMLHVIPLVMASGEIPFIIELATDVSELVQTSKEYRLLFDKTPCFISVLDSNLNVIQANEKLRSTFGDVQDRFCHQIFKQQESPCEDCPTKSAFEDGQEHSTTMTGLDKDGQEVHYMVSASPLVGVDGRVESVMEIATDITQVRKLEAEKLTAERLAAVGQTVAGLAHGIKNIITGLEGGLFVMNTGMRKGQVDKVQKGLEMLEGNISRISHFVKEFLDFARGKEPTVVMADPNGPAREVMDLYVDAAERAGVKLVSEIQDGIAQAPIDPEGIHACLANLVSNAIDACLMSEKDGSRVLLRTMEKDGVIIYEVSDNGSGMDCEVKRKVFTSFFSTKGSHQGTGLGLLVSRKIIQEHGGTIDFDSAENEGTVFYVKLPRNRLPAVKEPSEPANAEKNQ